MTKTLEIDRLELAERSEETDLGISEQTRACPECGKVLTLRGLHGHLRLAHKKSSKEIGKLASRAKVAPLSKMDEVFAMLDQLKEIEVRFDQIEELKDAGAFAEDETYNEFWDTLVGQEREVCEALKGYGISRPTREEKLEAAKRDLDELAKEIKKLKEERNKKP